MGLWSDVGRVASLGLDLVKNPAALLREWMFFLRSNPADYYQFLGDDVLEAQDEGFKNPHKELWLNLGYWREARTYPEACQAMAHLLAKAADFASGDSVLDVGFGFGEQDLLWARDYDLGSIVGINVTPLHVEVARKRVEERGLADRVDLQLGSATELPMEDNSIDKVVALECAFHFDTRETFFREAYRVLRPGGRLATADMLPNDGHRGFGFASRLGLRRWGVPEANVYDRAAYLEKLGRAGFEDATIESIRNHVFPGMHAYAEQRQAGRPIDEIVVEISDEDVKSCKGAEIWADNGGLDDYVIASAVKGPVGGAG